MDRRDAEVLAAWLLGVLLGLLFLYSLSPFLRSP